jgi:hypothetical protein
LNRIEHFCIYLIQKCLTLEKSITCEKGKGNGPGEERRRCEERELGVWAVSPGYRTIHMGVAFSGYDNRESVGRAERGAGRSGWETPIPFFGGADLIWTARHE